MNSSAATTVGSRTLRVATRFLPLVPLAAAVWVIQRGHRGMRWTEVSGALASTSNGTLGAALLLTLCSFLVLTGYDAVGLRFAGHRLPYRRSVFASLIASSVSQSLGFPLVTGLSIRYRLYAGWGLNEIELRDLLTYCSTAFWLGCLCLLGLVLLADPPGFLLFVYLGISPRPFGALLIVVCIAYLVWASGAERRVRMGGHEARAPGPAFTLAQLGLGTVDWVARASVLYVLLPLQPGALPIHAFLGVFLLAQIAGLASHVPGGLGVFEAVILTLLPAARGQEGIVAALLAYRAVYYVLPLVTALAALASREVWSRGHKLEGTGAVVALGFSLAVPPAMAIAIFTSGLVLLFSGSVPAAPSRIAQLERLVPLGVMEASHFLSSVIGAFLLVLAWAIQRRLDAAYHLSLALLATAAVLSLTKSLAYEQALLFGVLAAALLATRSEFRRRSSLLSEPWTPEWGVAICVAVLAAVGLGLIAHSQVVYADELWWRFTWDEQAPRFLRGVVGALGLIGVFAALRLLSPARPPPASTTSDDLETAIQLAAASPRSTPRLVVVGDKRLLFDDARTAFLMYELEGKCWVALGDPVGDERAGEELAWRFRALADAHSHWAVFYQVTPAYLPLYLDLGLTITKVGEAARVHLPGFSLDGGAYRSTRRAAHVIEKTGGTFRVAPSHEVPAILDDLREISDDWLSRKGMREKRFSLGRFDETYLSRTPVALLEMEERPVAFANLLEGSEGGELTVDLIRYHRDAPPSSMEYVLTQTMLWARSRGTEWFSLGMAPLAGMEARPSAPLWNHLGAAAARLGDHFYHFEGLRAYKASFDPVWEPRYLASPGGAALPRVLANVTTLIAGGIGGVTGR
jgi:phosphatidylglycerol lysyltransferase